MFFSAIFSATGLHLLLLVVAVVVLLLAKP
jgi:hypothetical protein